MIKITKDGRTIRTDSDYTKFRRNLYHYQSGECMECGWMTDLTLPPTDDRSFHVHHKAGRGLAGSKRDDTFEACIGLCGKDHRERHEKARQSGWQSSRISEGSA